MSYSENYTAKIIRIYIFLNFKQLIIGTKIARYKKGKKEKRAKNIFI